jgi:hypothetical protein
MTYAVPVPRDAAPARDGSGDREAPARLRVQSRRGHARPPGRAGGTASAATVNPLRRTAPRTSPYRPDDLVLDQEGDECPHGRLAESFVHRARQLVQPLLREVREPSAQLVENLSPFAMRFILQVGQLGGHTRLPAAAAPVPPD